MTPQTKGSHMIHSFLGASWQTKMPAVIAALLLMPWGGSGQPNEPSIVLPAECIRVIDGDTIVVRSSILYHVRLIDCWAPESRTKNTAEKAKGLLSKARMAELAQKGNKLTVAIPIGDDLSDSITLGRILGRVWLEDGRELSEIMVTEGLATKSKIETGDGG